MRNFVLAALVMFASANATVLDYGYRNGRDVVNGSDKDTYQERFVGSELAGATLSGDGDTDLDLYVYDFNGNLICKSEANSDDEICSWTPAWTGTFKIVVLNRGTVYNRYSLKLW